MKTIRLLFKLCIHLFVLIFVFCGILLYKYSYFSQGSQDNLINGFSTSATNYIYVDDVETTGEAVDKISDFIAGLDSDMTANFLSDGWKIILADNVSSEYSKGASGVTIWESRTILLNTYDDVEVEFKVFVHEFGHYFDLANGYLSISPEFEAAYSLYKDDYYEFDDSISTEYPTSSVQEFFASCFKEYYCYPEHLASIAPSAFEFLDTHIKEAEAAFSREEDIKNNLTGGLYLLKRNVEDILLRFEAFFDNFVKS